MPLSSPRVLSIVGLILIFGATLGFAPLLRELAPAIRWAVALAVVAAGFTLTCVYWRSIDEAAKEAQKSAWLWGGSAGMAFSLVVLAMASKDIFGLGALIPAEATPTRIFFRGASVVVVAQLVGFLAAWAIWWWRRR